LRREVRRTPALVYSPAHEPNAALAEVRKESPMEIPRTMKATVLVAPHRFELLDRPVPSPGDEDVLVRVRACGI
jgi:hypothetical protein